jgi:hypothetical protein
MNVSSNFGAVDIKEPSFDRPQGSVAATQPISEGTRVSLIYHGEPVSAQVTAIERLGTSFVGRVREFSHHEACHDDLVSGDRFRFRLRDVCSID